MQRRQWQPIPVLLPGKSHGWRSLVGCSPWNRKESIRLRDFTFTFHFHALEKEMATHFSVLGWRIPGTAEPGGLPSVGLHGVGHDWSNLAAACNCVFSECFFFLSLRGVTKFYHLILYFWMNLLFISNTEHHKHGFPKIFLVEGQWLEQIGIRQLTCQRWSFYTS